MTPVQEAAASNLPPGPWSYRPNDHDDWGFVRDADGNLIADTCTSPLAGEFRESTKYGTDEYWRGPPQARAVAELLIRARELVPADNAELITPEFLKSVGFEIEPNAGFTSLRITLQESDGVPGGFVGSELRLMAWDDDCWRCELRNLDETWPDSISANREYTTRGQLRLLCRALGIPLSESPAQEQRNA